MKFSEKLNTLLKLDKELDQKHNKMFSVGHIELIQKKIETYKLLYKSNKFVEKEISYKYFHDRLNLLMQDYYESQKVFTESDIDVFFEIFKNLELVEAKVVRNLRGAKLKNSENIYKIGNYEIYHFPTHKDYLQDLTYIDPEMLWLGQKNEYLIGINVFARDHDKASEIANSFFYKFEMCYYFINETKDEHHEIGILDYSPTSISKEYVLSKKIGSKHSSSKGSFRLIDIDDEYFVDTENGYDKMWCLISKDKPTNYEEKIISSIIWAGKSIIEKDIVDSFIQIAISLEVLLTYSQKDQIITPSITYQISESAALIIGDSYEARMKIENEIKKLYRIRSNIVHSGKKNIRKQDYYSFFFYVKEIIIKLLTLDKYKDINSGSDLNTLLKKTKYS